MSQVLPVPSVEPVEPDPAGAPGAGPGAHPGSPRRPWAEWWLALTAVFFLVAYSVPVISPDIDPLGHQLCAGVVWATWGVFFVDFVVQWRRAADRAAFLRHHWLDAIALLLPVFQPLRLVRLVTLLRVLNRLNRHAAAALRGRVTTYVLSATSLLVYLGALAVLAEERDNGGAIQTLGDAVWWATVTVTTVGYGDYYPITTPGRVVAGGLMVCGIALLGIVTASMAAWLLERIRQVEEQAQAATRADIGQLTTEIERLRDQIDQLSRSLGGAGAEAPAAASAD